MKINVLELTRAISNGELDASLSAIGSSITYRRDYLTNVKRDGISVGDTVYFTKAVKPSYLAGIAVKVTKINRKRIVVNLSQAIGRFSAGSIRTPLSIVQTTKPV